MCMSTRESAREAAIVYIDVNCMQVPRTTYAGFSQVNIAQFLAVLWAERDVFV